MWRPAIRVVELQYEFPAADLFPVVITDWGRDIEQWFGGCRGVGGAYGENPSFYHVVCTDRMNDNSPSLPRGTDPVDRVRHPKCPLRRARAYPIADAKREADADSHDRALLW